ncbi:unnamed protein product [Debaryomyces fabryi]|nr:unnamed protein product [Debaryomyces fabryi]
MWLSSYILSLIFLISISEKSLVLSCSGDVLPYNKLDTDEWIISNKYIKRRYPYVSFSCNSTICSIKQMTDYTYRDYIYSFHKKDILKSLFYLFGGDYIELVDYGETGLLEDDDDDGYYYSYSESTKPSTISTTDKDSKSSSTNNWGNTLAPSIYLTSFFFLLNICSLL